MLQDFNKHSSEFCRDHLLDQNQICFFVAVFVVVVVVVIQRVWLIMKTITKRL